MRLDESSAAFDTAVAMRKTHHLDDAEGTPMFAASLQGLSLGAALSDIGTRIAGFTVLSGVAPGSRVTLSAGDFDTLCQPAPGIETHEILRPLGLSPLQ